MVEKHRSIRLDYPRHLRIYTAQFAVLGRVAGRGLELLVKRYPLSFVEYLCCGDFEAVADGHPYCVLYRAYLF